MLACGSIGYIRNKTMILSVENETNDACVCIVGNEKSLKNRRMQQVRNMCYTVVKIKIGNLVWYNCYEMINL